MPHIDNIEDYYDDDEQARRESKRLINRVRTLEGEVRFLDSENAELHQTVIDQAAKLDELEARLERLEEGDDEPDDALGSDIGHPGNQYDSEILWDAACVRYNRGLQNEPNTSGDDHDDEPDELDDECNCWANNGPECVADHFGGQCYYNYIAGNESEVSGDCR